MKIKSQFFLSIAIFLAILLIIVFSIINTSAQLTQVSNREKIAGNIQTSISELSYVCSSYLIFQNSTQIISWQTKFSLMDADLARLDSLPFEQQTKVSDIKISIHQLNASFVELVLFLESTPQSQSIQMLPEFLTIWNQIIDNNEDITISSAQLAQQIHNQASQLQLHSILLITILLGLFGAYFFVNYQLMYRRTLRSIEQLRAKAAVIELGNLDHSAKIDKKDEIGQLSNSVNHIATDLRNVTALKSELEQEVARRKKAEAQLEQHSKNLEKLVEERTRQLKEKERLATIGETAAMVGHDLRNPLQTITGEVYIAKNEIESLPEIEQKAILQESIQTIAEQSSYMDKIVSDLQAFVKPVQVNKQTVNLKQAAAGLLSTINIPKNIQTSIQIDEALTAKADLQLLKRVLINLITNAIQAMPHGGELTIEAQATKESQVQITVKDTGTGIPDEIKPKIFTPLFTTKSKGQGFGLAVCKRVIEAQGGTISFESQEGKGTKFIIELPIT